MTVDIVSRKLALAANTNASSAVNIATGVSSNLQAATGTTLIGVQQNGKGAVARTLAAKMGEVAVSIVDFGAVADSTSYTTGTDNRAAIQNAIRYVWSQGGGRVYVPPVSQPSQGQPLESRVAYGWTAASGPIVIPSNVRLVGGGSAGSVLRRIDTSNTIGMAVGTYGPSNGTALSSCPKYTIADISATLGPSTNAVTLATPANAANFAVGDVICVEGTKTTFGNAGQFLPNMAARVIGVNASTGVITLDHALDDGDGSGYVTSNGVSPGIRNLRNDSVTAMIDGTGQAWPLFCAAQAGIENLGIDTPNTTGWPTPNLATYGSTFRDLEINANYLAGNPVAYSLFEDVSLKYYSAVTELAYLAHDTLFRRCTFARHSGGVANVAPVPLLWINQGEGAKRVHFERIKLVDRSDVTGTNTVQALGLRCRSTMTDSQIVIPKGNLGYLQGDSEIRNSTLICDNVTSSYAVNPNNSHLINCRIRGGNTYAVLVDGSCRVIDNIIGDQSNPPVSYLASDKVYLRNAAGNSVVRGNVTAKYSGSPTIWSTSYTQTITATSAVTSGNIADIPKGNLLRLLDLDWELKADIMLGITGTGTFKITLSGYDATGALYGLGSYTATSLPAGGYRLEIIYHQHEPYTVTASRTIRLTGASVYSSSSNATISISANAIVGFNLAISGMTSGDTCAVQSGRILLEPLGGSF
jgi:hypothetical protein